ncbi:MAG: hypothetical protein AAFS11_00230, partial [Planctomycetota bacterium]
AQFATPMLEPAGTVAGSLGDVEGGVSAAAEDLLIIGQRLPGIVHLHDPKISETLHSIPLDNAGLSTEPLVGPGGRLAATTLPTESGVWILDLTMPGDQSLTRLEGHTSWVYQLAVSSDGSLLASSEPQGDILLWDLHGDRLLTRIPRRASSETQLLVHNMDTAVAFTEDGTMLMFGEVDEAMIPGLTVLDLNTGSRRWTRTGSREATLDAVAAMLPENTPAVLYHHAALLANGKIVQSLSRIGRARQTVVRAPNSPDERVVLEDGASTRSGVAAHPTKPEYASGEYRIIRIRDADTNEVLHEIPDGSSSTVYGMAYSPDGSRLAIATEDGRVLIIETQFYSRIAEFRVPRKADPAERNYVYNLAWTPDGSRLISTGTNRLLIFESQRPFVRDHKTAIWNDELEAARSGSGSSPAAERVVAIERWRNGGTPSSTTAAARIMP